MKKISFIISLLFLLLMVVSQFSFAEEPVYGGTFIDSVQTNFGEMFNPILYESTYDQQIIDLIYNSLVVKNSRGEIVPDLAENWKYFDDGLNITFYLNKGVKFHDGHELSAEDVAFTFKTIMHPDYTGVRFSQYSAIQGAEEYKNGEANDVSGINVIDDYTISFSLKDRDATFLGNMQRGILPAHILKDIPIADLENAEFNRQPVGTGPFKFAEYVSQQYIVLEAFEDYFKERPFLDKYVIRRVATDSVPMYLVKQEIDLASIENKEQFKELTDIDFLKGYTRIAEAFRYFGINQESDALKEQIVRQALSYGFNKDIILKLLNGHGKIAYSAIPPSNWAYNDDINKYNYNPDRAKELLMEAGYKDLDGDGILEDANGNDLKLNLLTTSQDIRVEICEIFQQMMKQIGVEVEITLMEFNALVDMLYDSNDWDMYIMGWSTGPEPDMSWIFHSDSAWNDVKFFDDYNDELLENGKTTVDREKREEIYYEWQNYISERLPYIFLYYPELTTIINDRVKGFNKANQRGLFLDENGSIVHKIWIAKEKQ